MDLPNPRLALRRDLLLDGWNDDELARHLRRGEPARLRRGAYLVGGPPADAGERHRLLVHATLRSLRRPAVVSHQSAAVLHGLPLWGVGLARVHVTRRPPASSEIGRHLRTHVARLGEEEVADIDGVAVTDVPRTHRTDLAWEEERVIGEFDGRVKYGRLLRPGQEPGDAVSAEKRREDAIREQGWGVVRWTWAELEPGDVLGARVRRALARGRGVVR